MDSFDEQAHFGIVDAVGLMTNRQVFWKGNSKIMRKSIARRMGSRCCFMRIWEADHVIFIKKTLLLTNESQLHFFSLLLSLQASLSQKPKEIYFSMEKDLKGHGIVDVADLQKTFISQFLS